MSHLNKIIQHEDSIWKVIGVGVERDGKTFCHLASVHRFIKQKNGLRPAQICDFVPNDVLENRYRTT